MRILQDNELDLAIGWTFNKGTDQRGEICYDSREVFMSELVRQFDVGEVNAVSSLAPSIFRKTSSKSHRWNINHDGVSSDYITVGSKRQHPHGSF